MEVTWPWEGWGVVPSPEGTICAPMGSDSAVFSGMSPTSCSRPGAWSAGRVKAHRPMMISNVRLHSLSNGYRFDLDRRERVEAPILHAVDIEAIASS